MLSTVSHFMSFKWKTEKEEPDFPKINGHCWKRKRKRRKGLRKIRDEYNFRAK